MRSGRACSAFGGLYWRSILMMAGAWVSGFEDYVHELERIDREIHHFASVCAVDLADEIALRHCLSDVHASWSEDKARQSLRGLLMLRMKVETEMLAHGLTPTRLQVSAPAGPDGEVA